MAANGWNVPSRNLKPERTHLAKMEPDMSSCACRFPIASIKRGSRTMHYSLYCPDGQTVFVANPCHPAAGRTKPASGIANLTTGSRGAH